MEPIRPVETPPDDADTAAEPERFSPYAVPLSTLVAGVMVATVDQVQVQPDPIDYMPVPLGPDGADDA